ncbi:MAG: stalk domain-containing protein [Syntrophomonadaceae bacterium]
MKRGFMCLLLVFSMLVTPLSVQAGTVPRVFVDGEELSFDVKPIIVDDFILVPFEEVFQALGFDCYRPSDSAVCCGAGGEKFWMEVGSYVAWAQQKEIDLDVPAQKIDGKVLVPLKAVAQACMCKIEVDERASIVYITRGEHQTQGISLSEYYNPSTNETLGYSNDKFAMQSDEIVASAYFSGYISEGVKFEWLRFYDDKNYEVVMEETVNTYTSYSNCVARSILPQNKFRLGKWGVQTKVNDTVAQIRYFTIVNDSSIYGSLPWKNGTYTGYIRNGVPNGFGRLALKDGTSIEGDFSADGISYTNLVDKYSGGRCRNMNGVDDYVITCRIWGGQWKYPNGAEFTGSMIPWAVSKSEADFKLNKYVIVCEVSGKLSEKGLTRDVSGYYSGFDPSFKYNNFTFQSGPAGSFDNLIKVARFDKLDSDSNRATIDIGNGWTYTGEVYNTMANGKGSAVNVNGEKYTGMFVDNKFEGQGTYTWPDGQKYVGEFKNSALNGQGTMYYPNGSKKTGTWSSTLNDDGTRWTYNLTA